MMRARQILTEHREQLENLAKALLEHEMLDREEIMKVVSGETLEAAKKTRAFPRQISAPSGEINVTMGEEVPSNS